MFAGFIAALGGIKTFLIGGIGLIAATIVGVLWFQLHGAQAKLNEQKVDIERLEQQAIAQQIVIEGKQAAVEELERTNKEIAEQSAELSAQLEEIKNAPAKDNAPVAPVLERTLKRLRK
jgi:chromosome segregation ATPase